MGIGPGLLLLLLSLVSSSSASFLDFIENRKELPAGPAGRTQEELEQIFPNTNISVVQLKLAKHKESWTNQLKLDNKTEEDLSNRLKKYHPKQKKDVRKEGDTIHEINKRSNVTKMLYQGDIVLTVPQATQLTEFNRKVQNKIQNKILSNIPKKRNKRQAYVDRFYPATTWQGKVYYYFDASVNSQVKSVFSKAAAFWQANTCIDFQESRTARNKIRVFRGQGCYSYIGMINGIQDLSLGSGCESVGTAAHELGHALGFFHMQSRYDRDNYITVNVKNIQFDFVDQFDKETTSTNYNYELPYDYGSIMQYGGLSASRNSKPTMVAKEIKYQDTMGSDIVGFYDVSMMNEHYKCKARCSPATSAKCENGGFPHPRQCSACICPSGYGGTLCNERPSGCGKTLTATSNTQTLDDTVGLGSTTPLEEFQFCNYWIQAPAGSKIQITLRSFYGYYTDGCPYGGVEIKTNTDQALTGYRFCSNADAGTQLVSTSNLVPIITYNRADKSHVVLEYKIVAGADKTNTNDVKEVKETNTKTIQRCDDSAPNCIILGYFGYCDMPRVRNRCRWTCNNCR